jgi:D-alanyl-D-alanine carboxypeptidase/D-alanyl-D-alanine-endopeptidase (penicillin-binding protein 4)
MTAPPNLPTRRAVLGGLAAVAAGPALAHAPDRSPRPRPRGAGAGAPAAAATPRPAAPAAADLIAQARLGGTVTFAVANARSGLGLEGTEPGRAMPPASTLKAITALYALETLGAGFRFTTRVVADGPIRNGRLEGDLILVGGGDPTLGTDQMAELARAVKAAGLREVRGRFRVHEGALPYIRSIDPSQPDHVGYSPALSGLNLNYNRVHFEWRRAQGGYRVSMDARSDRYRPEVGIARMRVADRRVPLYTYSDANGIDDWTVARAALGESGSRWLPVRRPGAYAAEVFAWFARAQGIALPRPEAARGAVRGTVLAEIASADLRTILAEMLRWSTNITAEAVGLTASARLAAMPRSLAASGERMAGWLAARAGVRGARFADHSGLGDASRISAGEMVQALVQAGADGALRGLLRVHEMKDANGRTIQGHPARVVAKTGTLNFVSGLAGYIQTPSDSVLAFAVFCADLGRRGGLSQAERERPEGAQAWAARARRLQQSLIERWTGIYG